LDCHVRQWPSLDIHLRTNEPPPCCLRLAIASQSTSLVVDPPSPTSGHTPPIGALHKSSLKPPAKLAALPRSFWRLSRSLHHPSNIVQQTTSPQSPVMFLGTAQWHSSRSGYWVKNPENKQMICSRIPRLPVQGRGPVHPHRTQLVPPVQTGRKRGRQFLDDSPHRPKLTTRTSSV